ncbi:alkaline-phosphatase-like protein [Zopfochytrium polystomum]|nr:alkaline-phosphatase-like protein [Zopfochytrium polystomum]
MHEELTHQPREAKVPLLRNDHDGHHHPQLLLSATVKECTVDCNDRAGVEDTVSCGGITVSATPRARGWLRRFLLCGLAFLLAIIGIISRHRHWCPHAGKKNVILMISDGFGPASQTMARNYNAYIHNLTAAAQLPLDTILVGSSRTRSSDSFVTDSAAGATAFACVLKTYNGAIGVDPEVIPCGTVLEAAKAVGYKTGLVATSRITHATPASFSAHVRDRDMENEIAVYQIGNYTLGRVVDVMFGGGRCHFLPFGPGSCRKDNLNLIEYGIREHGWKYLETVAEFNNLDASGLPALGLFASDHMDYEIDRDPTKEPSLREMAVKALDLLKESSANSKKGFFIMIEGSRIDMAAHNNDPAAHVHDILAYNDAIAAVKDWVSKNPNTVMISVSDHETGGLSVAKQLTPMYPEYRWNPQALVDVKISTERLGPALTNYQGSDFKTYVKSVVIPDWLGIHDPTDEEIALLASPGKTSMEYMTIAGKMLSDRAELGWATHGHSAVDVNLYAYGLDFFKLRGNHENTDIGQFMVDLLGIDLESITKKLIGSPVDPSPPSAEWSKLEGFIEMHHHH